LFGWNVRLLITILQLKDCGNLVGVDNDFAVAADSKRDNLSNLGQKQGLGQVIQGNFQSIFETAFRS
jgi:hypothetical protein